MFTFTWKMDFPQKFSVFGFIHSVAGITTRPQIASLRRVSCRMWSNTSSFKLLHPLISVKNPVASYVHVFPSLQSFHLSFTQKCFRRQFLCKMWPIQFAFLLFFFVHRIFLSSSTHCNTSYFTWLVPMIYCGTIQSYAPNIVLYYV